MESNSVFYLKFSEFDYFSKYFNISFKKRLNNNFGLIYWFLLFYLIKLVIFELIIIFLIEDKNTLINFGSFGCFIIENAYDLTRLIFDLAPISFFTLVLWLLIEYRLDNNDWIIRINDLYNEIGFKFNGKLFAKTVRIYKLMNLITISSALFIVNTLIYVRLNYSTIHPVGFLLFVSKVYFGVVIGYTLIIRKVFIIFIILSNFIQVFSQINNSMKQIKNNNRIKHLIIIHFKVCDSLYYNNEYIKKFYIIIVFTFGQLLCYILYYVLFARIEFHETISIFMLIIASIFISLLLYLSLKIAFIDFESKRGLHSIHGLVFKKINRNVKFLVNNLIIFNKINLILFKIFRFSYISIEY